MPKHYENALIFRATGLQFCDTKKIISSWNHCTFARKIKLTYPVAMLRSYYEFCFTPQVGTQPDPRERSISSTKDPKNTVHARETHGPVDQRPEREGTPFGTTRTCVSRRIFRFVCCSDIATDASEMTLLQVNGMT